MHLIGSGHIPLEHTEMLQESPDLILALLILPRAIRSGPQTSLLRWCWLADFYMRDQNGQKAISIVFLFFLMK